jgi:RimJ/RimL family protein N-acetyltransferase/catechol 2,3-dioxygenase-like lactoylglutathione lyase family enzyme
MPATDTLSTRRLDLVPLDPDRDAAALHALYGDPEHDPYGTGPIDPDVEATCRRLRAMLAENGGWTWVVRVRPNDEALGTIGIFSDQGRSIRGLSWYLRRSAWGQGIMSEAARVVVDHLLAQPGITGVEAWIDTRNARSIAVARHAGLHEASRMARVYPDHTAQQVVMARSAEPRDDDAVALHPVLPVRDIVATAEALCTVLGLHEVFRYPDPPTMIRLALAPWAGSSGIDLVLESGAISPAIVKIETGIPTDTVHDRALAANLAVDGPPRDQPWYRRTFAIELAEGHRIQVHGPLRPEGSLADR